MVYRLKDRNKLTHSESSVLRVLQTQLGGKDNLTNEQICNALGYAQVGGINYVLDGLVRRGLIIITKANSWKRKIELVKDHQSMGQER